MHPALNWEIKSVINSSHFYTLCWTKVERENYISIYVSQYCQLGHIESFFFFIARPGSYCKKYVWLLRIFTLFSKKYSSQEMSLCLLLSFIWQSRLLRNQILFPLISPAGKLSKADSKAKTSSIHPTSHCGEARNKSFEIMKKNLFYKLHARVNIWTPWQSTIFENFTRAYSWKTFTYSFLEASILFDSLNYSLGWSQRNYQKNPKQSPQKVPKILKMCVVFPSPQVLSSPCSNLTLSEKKRPKSWKMSPSPDDIVTQYFVSL